MKEHFYAIQRAVLAEHKCIDMKNTIAMNAPRKLVGKFGTRTFKGRAATQKRADVRGNTAPGVAFAARKRAEAAASRLAAGDEEEGVDEFQFVGGSEEDGKAKCLTCGSLIRYRNMCKHIERCTSLAQPPTNVTMAQMRNWNVAKDGIKQANQGKNSGLYKAPPPHMLLDALCARQKNKMEVVSTKHQPVIVSAVAVPNSKIIMNVCFIETLICCGSHTFKHYVLQILEVCVGGNTRIFSGLHTDASCVIIISSKRLPHWRG